MIRVGCAGFSIPQTRYFQELLLLEVQETAIRTPGPGTVSRWHREAPPGFEWTLLAPPLALDGGPAKLGAVLELARTLRAKAAVLQIGADIAATKPNRAALRKACDSLPRAPGLSWVVELPSTWRASERKAVASECGVVVAGDPLAAPPPAGSTAYLRLPGPAGHRSRYEDAALAEIAAISSGFADSFVIFANADMHADGKRFRRLVE